MPDNYKKKTKAQTQAEDAAIARSARKSIEALEAISATYPGSDAESDAKKAALSASREELRIVGASTKPLGLDLPVTNVKRIVKRTKRPPADKVKVKRGGLRVTRPQSLKKAIFRKKR